MVPMPVLIAALAIAGVYYGGKAAVHAAKRAEHAIVHPQKNTVHEKCWENSEQTNCAQKLVLIEQSIARYADGSPVEGALPSPWKQGFEVVQFERIPAGVSCTPGEAAGSGYNCGPWVERRFDSLDAAVTYFSQPGKSSTSNPREYLARFVQPDGSVVIRTVP